MDLLPMKRLDDPFFPVRPPRAEGMLARDNGHAIYWEDAGALGGMPVIQCHGGPGGSSNAARRRFYDDALFRIVRFDQRGCGRSTPAGHLDGITLQATIADMEAIREMLGIEKWIVAGGSWGSTVALAYAEAHPDRCLGLNLTCMWLCRAEDIDWWFHGVRTMFPELWASFASLVEPDERHDMRAAYVKRILGNDKDLAAQAGARLRDYEVGFMQFDAGLAEGDPAQGAAYGRIFAHYAKHDFFVRDTELLDNAHRVAHLPVDIVTGRYDCCCPPKNSYDLARVLPKAELTIVPGAGHYSTEVAMSQAVARAPARLRARILGGGM